jgi:von Willebrand factor type A domain/Aerotolerance regulator N-terminal
MAPLATLPLFAFLFEAPLFAAAAAGGAVGVPIIIHLLNRKRYRVVHWAAMRFLLAAQRKTSRKVRIEQILLLIVRCLLLLLLLAAMCSVTPWAEAAWRWFAPSGLAVAGGATRTHKVLVVDGSLGMGFRAGDAECFEKARAAAKQIVHESNGGDGFSIVLLAAPPRMIVPGPTTDGDPGLPSEDAEKVLARIDGLHRTDGNADLAAALNTVEDLLEASPPKYVEKEVYFLTNLQRTTWVAHQPVALAATVQKIQAHAKTTAILDVGQDGAENLAVEGLTLTEPITVAHQKTLLQAVLHNFGDTRTNVAVRLLVGKANGEGQRLELRQAVDAPPVKEIKSGEQVRVSFEYTFPDPGDYVVQVEVDHDGLETDDARRVVVTVKDRAPVLLVNGKPAGQAFDQAAEYVRTALNPFSDELAAREAHIIAQPKVISETQFADEGLGDLTPYDCVFLCDVPRFTEAEAHRLLNHVRRGGGVVVAVGDRVDLAAYNDVLFRGGAGLLPARLVEKQSDNDEYTYQFTLEPEMDREPTFKVFTESRPREMLLKAGFHKFLKAEPAVKGNPRTLLSFAPMLLPGKDPDAKLKSARPPGGPALLEWRPPAGKDGAEGEKLRGRVVLITTTLNADWNSWPASPIFPPFIDRLMYFAAAGRFRERAVEVGEPIELFLPTAAAGAAVIHTPDGREASTPIRSLDDVGVVRWPDADISGVYRVSIGSQPDQVVAVNPPALNETQQASPSDLARIRPDDLKTAYPDWDLQVVSDLHQVTHAAGAAAAVEYEPLGASVAHVLLLILLVLFFSEVLLAWVFGHYSAVATLEEEAARRNITRRRWMLTVLPLYLTAGLLFTFLIGVGAVLLQNAWTGDFLSFLPDGVRRMMEASQGVAPPADGEASRWNLESSAFLLNSHYDSLISITLFVLAAVMVVAVYFREGRNVGVGSRLLMAGLRLGLLAMLLLVILPQLRVWYERQGWPDVAIILDDSESMSTFDHYRDPKVQAAADALAQQAGVSEPDRLRLAQTLVTRPEPDWLRTLLTQRKVRLHVYHCSTRLHRLADVARMEDLDAAVDAIHNLQADARNDSTQLGAAVRQVLGEYNASSLAAVVVLTDGVTTEGENLEQASEYAKDQGVPLFFVGLGDANDVRNIQLHDLQAVDSVYVNDHLYFELTLTGQGYPGLTIPITLKEKGKEGVLDKKMVTLKTAGEDVKVQLETKPTEPGEKTYIIETPLQTDEADKEDNRIERKVFVREAKLIKVLYVEGYRRYEYHFLKTLLERESDRTKGNKSIDLKVVLLNADADFAVQDRTALAEIPTKEELKAYDVVILGDVDPRPKNNKMTEHMKDIAEWVTDHGGGLLMVAGERYAPFYYKDSPLRDVLPIDVVADHQNEGDAERTEGYKPDLTPEGRRHPIFRFSPKEGDDEEIWKHLREMYWWSDVCVPKRAAEVLAYHPKARAPVDKDRPGAADRPPERQALVVQQFVGAGRSMFFGFDESWRWGFREDQLHYNQFWIQTIRYLSGSRRDRVDLQLDRETPYRRGEPIKITVRFPDDSPPPGKDAPVKLLVERRNPAKGAEAVVRTLELTRIEGRRASYGAVLTQTPEGLYSFVLTDPSLPSPRPSAECKVLAPPGEMDQLRMNQTEMEHAADKTHGKFYTIADADNVLKDLPTGSRVRMKAPPSAAWTWWNAPMFFLAALLALATEWVLRKQKNLV